MLGINLVLRLKIGNPTVLFFDNFPEFSNQKYIGINFYFKEKKVVDQIRTNFPSFQCFTYKWEEINFKLQIHYLTKGNTF